MVLIPDTRKYSLLLELRADKLVVILAEMHENLGKSKNVTYAGHSQPGWCLEGAGSQ